MFHNFQNLSILRFNKDFSKCPSNKYNKNSQHLQEVVEKMVRLELVGDKVTVSYGEKNNEVTTPCFTIQTPDLKY